MVTTTKQFLALGCFLIAILDKSTAKNHPEKCASWPSGLKTLAECCDIPVHNDKDIENTCTNDCASKSNYSEGDHIDCALNCYTNKTRILTRKGKFNAHFAASLYEKNDTAGQWTELIKQGVASCHYESNGTAKENFPKYFNCVDEYLTKNCVRFKNDDGCYEVYNHMKDCTSALDCPKLHKNLHLEASCCKLPYFLNWIGIPCKKGCFQKEFEKRARNDCAMLCHYYTTGLLSSDNSINYDKVRENLQKNPDYSEKWIQPIESATEICKNSTLGL